METSSLTFAAPLWLWALALLPLIGGLFIWSHRRGRELLGRVVAPRLRAQLAGSVSTPRRVLRSVLLLAALGFAFVALAQPRLGYVEREIKQEGRDVIVAIDTSRSMLATDVPPTRLVRAKLFTQDLLRLVRGDRMGLIAFAGSAFLQAPLTLDYSAVTTALEELDTTIIPRGGTNIAAAISAAREAFGKAEGKVRALVILTDGEELDADGIAAAKKAANEGIRIFTVGIGSPEGSLIPITLPDGRQDFVRDNAGKPVTSILDESRLREIATATGGFYTQIGPDAARAVFLEGIEPMDRAEMGVFSARRPIERFQWPLAAAVACLALSLLPGDRRRVGRVAAVIFLCATPAYAGLQDYQNGEYEKASESFQEHLRSQPTSRKLQFNAGAAAYKTGDFDKAIGHFTEALLAGERQLKEDASYNLANSLVRKGEASEETDARKSSWENAIEHYEETLRLNPDNKKAKDNLEITRKLLEELENQQQQDEQNQEDQQQQEDQQDQQDQQKNDDQKDQQDKSDKEENQDQQNQDQNKQEDQQDKQDQDDPSKDQEQSDANDQANQQDKQDPTPPQPTPEPTPGDKKEGELKSADEQAQPTPTPQEADRQPAEPAGGEEREGEISPAQARALLNSLSGDEQKVNLMEQQTSQEVLRDW